MRRLLIGDRKVRVRDEGESKRAPVVLIHGAGASSAIWIDVVKRLAPRRRVIAPDLPGHGQSDPWPHKISIDLYRDAIGTICATLGVKQAVLVGHSMGGAIALSCALAWPERVAAVVLVNSAARYRVAPSLFAAFANGQLPPREMVGELWFSPQTPPDLVEKWSVLTFGAPSEVGEADFRAVDGLDLREQLPKLKSTPLLAIGGADDLLLPPKLTVECAERVGNGRAAIIPHAAHMSFQERPDEFFAALDGFLREVP